MSENSLQITVAQYLRLALHRDSFFFHCPNEIPDAGQPQRMRRWREKMLAYGLRPGVPDIIVFHKSEAFAIELKWGQGELSTSQRNCHADLAAAEVPTSVCRNLDQVYEALTAWGIPLKFKPI